MARAKKYGKTWWGNAWVEALEKIDLNSNRLPRGKSYANTGKVIEIKLDENYWVKAKVQGKRIKPYKVEIKLPRFAADQKNIIKSIIAQDPAMASELSLGRLPHTILDILKKHDLSLLPESWDDITGSCSCPDWANPCKHLAAVYYIMAGEIDKDPFMLFRLHNLEADELLQAAGVISRTAKDKTPLLNQKRTSLLPFIPYAELKVDEKNPFQKQVILQEQEQRAQQEKKQQESQAQKEQKAQQAQQISEDRSESDYPFDLSNLAESSDNEAFFALLNKSPFFYPEGDFKTVLLKAYKNVTNALGKQGLIENGFNIKNTEFTLLYPSDKEANAFSFFVSPGFNAIVGTDAGEGEIIQSIPFWNGTRLVLKRKKGKIFPAGTVLDLFLSLPLKLHPEQSTPRTENQIAADAQAGICAGIRINLSEKDGSWWLSTEPRISKTPRQTSQKR